MTSNIKRKIYNKKCKNFNIELLNIILRIIEVIFVGFISCYLAYNANFLTNKQLLVMKTEVQPIFNIFVEKSSDDFVKDSMIISFDNIGGAVKNIDIMLIPALVVNYYLKDNPSCQTKKIRINDMFYGITFQRSKGIVKEYHDNGNFEKYIDLYFSYLAESNLDGNVNLNSIIKVTYEDIFNEGHTEYYELDNNQVKYIDYSYGEKKYEEFDNLRDSVDSKDLNIEFIRKMIIN